MTDLSGKTALVTGGRSGIGAATALALVRVCSPHNAERTLSLSVFKPTLWTPIAPKTPFIR